MNQKHQAAHFSSIVTLMMTIGLIFFLVTACTTTDNRKVVSAVTTPLSDLNLIRDTIPEVLLTAMQAPYAVNDKHNCDSLRLEIHTLTTVLGPDFDATMNDNKQDAATLGKEIMTNALQSSAQSVIPFRSWVRKLTGAEKQSKQVAAAIAAGTVRRAFLKGQLAGGSCRESLPQ